MKLLCDDMIRALARALRATLPEAFTGQVVVRVNFHQGTAASAVVGFEEGLKLKAE